MPAISLDTLQSALPQNKAKGVYDSIFGEEAIARKKSEQARENAMGLYQQMIQSRRGELEKQRTNDRRIATFNALGNALTTMVQPLGWAVGGTTGGVQPYDNRQYIEAYNRAVKADDEIRDLNALEDEYKFKLADQDYRRALAQEDEIRRAKLRDEAEAKTFERRLKLAQEQGNIRINVEDIKGKYKVRAKGGSGNVTEEVGTTFLKRAATAYNNYKADYLKKQAIGIEMKEDLKTWEEFLGEEAAKVGLEVTEKSGEATPTPVSETQSNKSTASSSGKKGGFSLAGSTPTTTQKGKKGGFQK